MLVFHEKCGVEAPIGHLRDRGYKTCVPKPAMPLPLGFDTLTLVSALNLLRYFDMAFGLLNLLLGFDTPTLVSALNHLRYFDKEPMAPLN